MRGSNGGADQHGGTEIKEVRMRINRSIDLLSNGELSININQSINRKIMRMNERTDFFFSTKFWRRKVEE